MLFFLMSISKFSQPEYKAFLREEGRGDFKGRRGRKKGESGMKILSLPSLQSKLFGGFLFPLPQEAPDF